MKTIIYILGFALFLFICDAFQAQAQSTCPGTPTVADNEGNMYKTVQIGTQCWMQENLRSTVYANGTPIKKAAHGGLWRRLRPTDKAYSWYDNDSVTNANKYGALYTWAAAMNGTPSSNENPSGVQGVCPDGWHLPSNKEWEQLSKKMGGSSSAGGKLKQKGTTTWSNPNTGGSNRSGFTALAGGMRNASGKFDHEGNAADWWSATESNTSQARGRYIMYNQAGFYQNSNHKRSGYYVRCIKN